MPHSLRVKIKNLRYKGIITDKDCDRLITALDSKDVLDKILDEIRGEIEREAHSGQWSDAVMYGMIKAGDIIDRYRIESEDEKCQK